jgi:hypothetical protein
MAVIKEFTTLSETMVSIDFEITADELAEAMRKEQEEERRDADESKRSL